MVSVEAARRIGDSRPDLTAEALAFARRTARETQSALRRLVAVMQVDDPPAPQAMTAPIETLIAGFSRLGRPVSVSLPADLAGPAAEAAHGIIREALTNALRYAPGAAVSVRVQRAGDTLHLTVDNGRPPGGAGTDTAGIGSGRGVEGSRSPPPPSRAPPTPTTTTPAVTRSPPSRTARSPTAPSGTPTPRCRSWPPNTTAPGASNSPSATTRSASPRPSRPAPGRSSTTTTTPRAHRSTSPTAPAPSTSAGPTTRSAPGS
ncbi:sensor histidine kinase [Streptomyces sp. enrichment culture]|uniref:sensor histidine kinase n=1 Tax=Streptomyces sp. enrichment culture TaxID=1795815 RepID=UPI003F55F2EB